MEVGEIFMKINMNEKGPAIYIFTEGEIDHHNAEELRDKIDGAYERSACKHMVFDFTKVTFMDSSGIGLLIGRYKNAEKRGGAVSIAGSAVTDTRLNTALCGLVNSLVGAVYE